jgi:hypothetical protein
MTAPERFAEKSDSLLHRGRRPYMTHNVTWPSSIAALRKVHSITSSAATSRACGTAAESYPLTRTSPCEVHGIDAAVVDPKRHFSTVN